jgi:hypothetical protein
MALFARPPARGRSVSDGVPADADIMVSFKEEMRKEVEQYNWNRQKNMEERERRHLLQHLLRIIRKRCKIM